MTDLTLHGRKILVVEDEYMLAQELGYELGEAGAVVIGLAASVARALEVIAAEPSLDGAILDINLGGERIDPVADALASRGVPFVFVTGYDKAALPRRFSQVICLEKPVNMARIGQALLRAMQT